jgi:peptidoglycan hydrolase-like protein with peptidoglycan-binding domain
MASKLELSMSRKLIFTALIFLSIGSLAWADRAVETAQQKLKDEGFYYGEINGKKDADTTAAIRRYQIRNGMRITGDLDTETQRALGLTSKPASTPAPQPRQTPGPPPPDYSEQNVAPRTTPVPHPPAPARDEDEDRAQPEDEDRAQPPVPPNVQRFTPFGGTPYESAPPQVQQDIISRAQIILLRQGYYRDDVDGAYGPAMRLAVRNYQARFGLHPTGLLDVETLALLNLLPEQQVASDRRFHRRFFPPHPRFWRPDERIYFPR